MQGDLFLCKACETYRFPYVNSSGGTQSTSTVPPSVIPTTSVCTAADEAVSLPALATTSSVQGINVANGDEHRCHIEVQELLTYVSFYRNRSTAASLIKVVTSFFSSAEITEAKKCMKLLFGTVIADSQFVADRRNSTSRPQHVAEVEDIIGMFDLVDAKGCLQSVKFTAADLTRLPTYSPEQTNMCAVSERQAKLEASVENLTTTVNNAVCTGSLTAVSDMCCKIDKVENNVYELFTSLQSKIDSLSSLVAQLSDPASKSNGASDYSRELNVVLLVRRSLSE